jgi:hypothetical protein
MVGFFAVVEVAGFYFKDIRFISSMAGIPYSPQKNGLDSGSARLAEDPSQDRRNEFLDKFHVDKTSCVKES